MTQIEIVGGSLGYALAILVERNSDGSVKKIIGYAVIGPDGKIINQFDNLNAAVACLEALINDLIQADEDTQEDDDTREYKGPKF